MSGPDKQQSELAMMLAFHGQSQVIGEFIDWLSSKGMTICSPTGGLKGTLFHPVGTPTEELLAQHFGIDLQAAEAERRAILADLRAEHA